MIKLPALFAIKDIKGFLDAANKQGFRNRIMAEAIIRHGVIRVEKTSPPHFAAGQSHLYDTEIPYGLGTIGIREDELQFFEVVSDE